MNQFKPSSPVAQRENALSFYGAAYLAALEGAPVFKIPKGHDSEENISFVLEAFFSVGHHPEIVIAEGDEFGITEPIIRPPMSVEDRKLTGRDIAGLVLVLSLSVFPILHSPEASTPPAVPPSICRTDKSPPDAWACKE